MRASTFVAPGVLLVAALSTAPAAADVKIAFIDPLSGGAATTGILAQKTHQFYIDAINALTWGTVYGIVGALVDRWRVAPSNTALQPTGFAGG